MGFHWGTDWRPSMSCPSRSHEMFTCPAVDGGISDHGNTSSSSTSGTISKKMTRKEFFLIIVVLIVITFIVLRLLEMIRSEKYREGMKSLNTNTNSTIATGETNGLVGSNGHSGHGYLAIASRSDS